MRHSVKTGFVFGSTSGIITTLGLMVGLHSSTQSRLAVLGGILTIAIADAFSDALGIHLSEESENRHTTRQIWESTAATFGAKFAFAMTFVFPVLVLPLAKAVVVSILWGLSLLCLLSLHIARERNSGPWRIIIEHLLIGAAVIVATHYVGDWIGSTFH
jgi:VIT1/CCC1 family predicted Fe2+/Mn2+ transporter